MGEDDRNDRRQILQDGILIRLGRANRKLVALRANVPVIPVFIRSNSRFAEKGWPLWKRPRFPITMEFELGEPLHPEPGETSQSFTARLQAVYERELSKPHPLRREVGV